MSRYFWIFFVLWGVWQAIGSMVEKAGKKQQDQRLKELTAQRQRQLSARRGGPAAAGETRGGPIADRVEGLAARRKAQLEELRRRRTAHQPGAAPQESGGRILGPTTLGAGTPSVGRPNPPQRRPRPVPIARSAPPARQAPVPPTTAPPPTPPTRRRAPTGTAAQRVVTPQARRPAQPEPQMDPHSVFIHKKVSTEPARRRRPAITAGEPIDRAILRKMIIYREILDPPLALRAEQVWER